MGEWASVGRREEFARDINGVQVEDEETRRESCRQMIIKAKKKEKKD